MKHRQCVDRQIHPGSSGLSWPVRNFKASAAWIEAMICVIGAITPAVSQVAEVPGAGRLPIRHRRQGDLPGRIGMHKP